jgi:hypothetical protein
MGLVWEEDAVLVRPFRDTQTYRNLQATRCGVASISDDVLAYVQSALTGAVLPGFSAVTVPGIVFRGACSWLELTVVSQGGSDERAEFHCRVLHKGRQRDFLGFCRASSAIIEATILATRLPFCDRGDVVKNLNHYTKIVEKTGGENEKQAFQLVCDYIRKREEP